MITSSPTSESLWSRLGIPKLSGNGKFVSATAIDSIGTGLILAFTVVYFATTTSASLPAIGVAITLARLLALPTSVIVGPLIDRFMARRVAAAGNLVSAVGYLGFLLAGTTWSIVVVTLLVQVGHTTYWTSSSALVALAAPKNRRTRWFGFIYSLRNSGMGIGGALGAFAFALGEVDGLHLIAIANAASFFLAAILLSAWRPVCAEEIAATEVSDVAALNDVAAESPEVGSAPSKADYRTVLRDRRYTTLIGINATLVFAQMLIKILLAIYIVEALDMSAWIAGTLIMLNTIQVALTQTVISRRMEHHRATRVISTASLLNATAFGLFALLCVTPNWSVVSGLFVAMIVFTLGEIIGFPAIENLSVAMAPDHIRGRYLAVYQLSWTVGEIVAPGILTFLLARGAVLPMLFLLALSLLAVPMLLTLERMTVGAGKEPALNQAKPLRQA